MLFQMESPSSQVYYSQRLRLQYVEWGKKTNPPTILLHGGRDHARSWDWVARSLCKDWRVLAPDLRGHGDSEWVNDGNYQMASYLYDLDQLICQQLSGPVNLVAHSLGAMIALRYAGLYPSKIGNLIAIEGLGLPNEKPMIDRLESWISQRHALSSRNEKRYENFDDAVSRMMAANSHLSYETAEHLTRHGVKQNEDGTYSWKFDNYIRSWPAYDMPQDLINSLWSQITCPTLLVGGRDSWHQDPTITGRIKFFKNVKVKIFDKAGHWVHHDRREDFIELVNDFLR